MGIDCLISQVSNGQVMLQPWRKGEDEDFHSCPKHSEAFQGGAVSLNHALKHPEASRGTICLWGTGIRDPSY